MKRCKFCQDGKRWKDVEYVKMERLAVEAVQRGTAEKDAVEQAARVQAGTLAEPDSQRFEGGHPQSRGCATSGGCGSCHEGRFCAEAVRSQLVEVERRAADAALHAAIEAHESMSSETKVRYDRLAMTCSLCIQHRNFFIFWLCWRVIKTVVSHSRSLLCLDATRSGVQAKGRQIKETHTNTEREKTKRQRREEEEFRSVTEKRERQRETVKETRRQVKQNKCERETGLPMRTSLPERRLERHEKFLRRRRSMTRTREEGGESRPEGLQMVAGYVLLELFSDYNRSISKVSCLTELCCWGCFFWILRRTVWCQALCWPTVEVALQKQGKLGGSRAKQWSSRPENERVFFCCWSVCVFVALVVGLFLVLWSFVRVHSLKRCQSHFSSLDRLPCDVDSWLSDSRPEHYHYLTDNHVMFFLSLESLCLSPWTPVGTHLETVRQHQWAMVDLTEEMQASSTQWDPRDQNFGDASGPSWVRSAPFGFGDCERRYVVRPHSRNSGSMASPVVLCRSEAQFSPPDSGTRSHRGVCICAWPSDVALL